MKDEKIYGFLTRQGIEWKLNLSRAPWWGRQFERLIGLVKGSFYKSIGNGLLSWMELQEVLLDVEVYCTYNRTHCQSWNRTTCKTMISKSLQSTRA